MTAKTLSAGFLIFSLVAITLRAASTFRYEEGSLAKQEPQAIYAADPHDSWNRIFYLLFTRTTQFRLTEDFKEASPLIPSNLMGRALSVSAGTFKRIESGDRAIDPLYPSFLTSTGIDVLLADPVFSELTRALNDACAEREPRSPLHRALMQADAWAAYDILSRFRKPNRRLSEQVRELLPLLDQFIAKLALSPEEIAALPRNYDVAQRNRGLPQVFDQGTGWTEVEWLPQRLHDDSADYRRAARVSLKPITSPEEFLADVNNRLRQGANPLLPGTTSRLLLAGVALVTQGLLIDSHGRIVPSPLTYEVQLRTFVKDERGNFRNTKIAQYELSRKLLLSDPSSDGFIYEAEDAPAYLPSSGNDYSFASPHLGNATIDTAILGNLRRRCQLCHGEDESLLLTFAMHLDPKQPVQPVRAIQGSHVDYVVTEKMKRADFKTLKLPR